MNPSHSIHMVCYMLWFQVWSV